MSFSEEAANCVAVSTVVLINVFKLFDMAQKLFMKVADLVLPIRGDEMEGEVPLGHFRRHLINFLDGLGHRPRHDEDDPAQEEQGKDPAHHHRPLEFRHIGKDLGLRHR